eukprot:symbB.v1.2.018221.t2/scaffold1421.1/size119699/2
MEDQALQDQTDYLVPGTRVLLQGDPDFVGSYNGYAGVVQMFHEAELAYTVQLDPQSPHDFTVLKVSYQNVVRETGAPPVPLSLLLPVQDAEVQDDIGRDRTVLSMDRNSELDTLKSLHINPGHRNDFGMLLCCTCVAASAGSNSCSSSRKLHSPRARHVLSGTNFEVELREDHAETTGQWSGNKVWPGALALLGHLNDHYDLEGLKILELGCGLPFLSAALVALGAQVCATDHPKVLERVELEAKRVTSSLTLMQQQGLSFEAFAWGAEQLPQCAVSIDLLASWQMQFFKVILVYDGFPVEALYESITRLLKQNSNSIAVFALQPRRFPMTAALKEPQLISKFLRRFAEQGWQVSVTPVGKEALGLAQQPPPRDCEGEGHRGSEGLVIASITAQTSTLQAKKAKEAKELHYRREELVTEEL